MERSATGVGSTGNNDLTAPHDMSWKGGVIAQGFVCPSKTSIIGLSSVDRNTPGRSPLIHTLSVSVGYTGQPVMHNTFP